MEKQRRIFLLLIGGSIVVAGGFLLMVHFNLFPWWFSYVLWSICILTTIAGSLYLFSERFRRYWDTFHSDQIVAWLKRKLPLHSAEKKESAPKQKKLPYHEQLLADLQTKESSTKPAVDLVIADFKVRNPKTVESYNVTLNTGTDQSQSDVILTIGIRIDSNHFTYKLSDGTDKRQIARRPKGWSIEAKIT